MKFIKITRSVGNKKQLLLNTDLIASVSPMSESDTRTRIRLQDGDAKDIIVEELFDDLVTQLTTR